MRAVFAPIVFAFLLCASASAQAPAPATTQTLGRHPTLASQPPYPPVGLTLPNALDDAGWQSFRKQLAAAARGRIYADLASLVIGIGFFWDRDFTDSYDPRRSGVENLARAIRLEADNGRGWERLAALAAEPTAAPIASLGDALCAPAMPSFDGGKLDDLIDTTRTREADWSYPRGDRVPLRAAAAPNAPVLELLGAAFVRRVADEDGGEPGRDAWLLVAAPSGKVGFVAAASMGSLAGERLCYGKDFTGAWRIVGYVGPGN
jgi:hypothetical protein